MINRDDCLLKNVIETNDDLKKKEIYTIDTLNHILNTLVGDYMKPLYYKTAVEELQIKSATTNTNRVNDQEAHVGQIKLKEADYEQMSKDYIFRDLFIWTILMNYIETAKVMLAHMKYRICAAGGM
ncbi:unnamed protein product, partial [Didymodactylos carnosus]